MKKTTIHLEAVDDSNVDPLPDVLGFGRYFTQRMFTQRYSPERGWHDPVIGPYRPLSLDPATELFHNGQMIFEGTKAYRRPDGNVNLFRVEKNAERFNLSAARMSMPSVDTAFHIHAIEELIRLEHRWVPAQENAALYIRPVMLAMDRALEVRASHEYLHYVILSPVSPYFARDFEPIAVYVAHDFVRATRGGTGEAKTPGNYAASIAATEIALGKGYQQVLWLDALERRYVDEVGAMNIAFVYGGAHLVTPALTGAILRGVTRDSILRLAPELGLTVSEKRIEIDEVINGIEDGRITEAFGMGTGAVIAPVGRLSYQDKDIPLSDGQPGPVARRVYDALTGIQYGRQPDPYNWTRTIDVRGTAAGVSDA